MMELLENLSAVMAVSAFAGFGLAYGWHANRVCADAVNDFWSWVFNRKKQKIHRFNSIEELREWATPQAHESVQNGTCDEVAK